MTRGQPSLRRLLPRTFTPFFHRFPRATPIQTAAIPRLLAGDNTLLCAPTAAGKTEAFAAPLVERVMANGAGPFGLLIISPTRALANDLKRRLTPPLHQAGVTVGRYTGEHKEQAGKEWPTVVITTPEALDSLLARRRPLLAGVQALVLDEIHILDGTPRGDQMRILLGRLPRQDQQRVAVSATVQDPAALAERYGITGEPIVAGSHQPIRAKMFQGKSPKALVSHLTTLAEAGLRKILIFANSRNSVEKCAAALPDRTPFGRQIYAHHGSLAESVRARTERLFWDAPAAVCIATLTLELGIDIGTVDYVLLLDPPHNPASLRQRVGRGTRRSTTSRVGCICADQADELFFRVLLQQAARGDLCRADYSFRPSVILQQALVLAGADEYVTAKGLAEVLPPDIGGLLPPQGTAMILEQAVEKGIFEPAKAGRFVLPEGWERRYRIGTLHGNIAESRDIAVIDRLTGDQLGVVNRDQEQGKGQGQLSLAGQQRSLAWADENRILTDAGDMGKPAVFSTHARPVMPFVLARKIAAELGAGEGEIVQCKGKSSWLLLHGSGTIGGILLSLFLQNQVGVMPVTAGPLFLRLNHKLTDLPQPGPEEVKGVIKSREKKLTLALAMGPYHFKLPIDIRRQALHGAAGFQGIVDFFAKAKLIEKREETPGLWEDLANQDLARGKR